MDGPAFGRSCRTIRKHLGETQATVSRRAGVSQSTYSVAERGEVAGLKVGTLDRIAASLGATIYLGVRYQGGLIDRLIDRAHARIVDVVVGVLHAAGWETEVEFSFSVFGERGSVDVLAWHASTRTLLIVEVKSRFTDLQAMLLSLGRKLRLVPDIVRKERGWSPLAVGRIVVVPGTSESRAIVARHPAIFASSLPARAREVRAWIRQPSGAMAGVWFVSADTVGRPATIGSRSARPRTTRVGPAPQGARRRSIHRQER